MQSRIIFYSKIKILFFALLALMLFTACESNTPIVNSIPEREANEIVVLLYSHGIQAQKVAAPTSSVGGGAAAQQMWDIVVPSSQITDSLAILNKAGLPRVKGTNLLDLFGSQGLVPSDMQDRIRYQEGLSEQLANTIRKFDGIIDADVQISLPSDEDSKKPITASVYVKHQGVLDNPNSLLITKIKRLVASSVPGLTVDNVTVVADRALYSDINLPMRESGISEEKSFTSIWSILIAKESVGRFQLIFYLFLIVIFILLCIIAWLIWKFFPILQKKGFDFLFSPNQVAMEQKPSETIESSEEPKDET